MSFTSFNPEIRDVPFIAMTDLDDVQVQVRPIFDEQQGRNVLELVIGDSSAFITNLQVLTLIESMKSAALLGEVENVARLNPTPVR